jgi:pyrroloquinoline quinone biosynthesis protein B
VIGHRLSTVHRPRPHLPTSLLLLALACAGTPAPDPGGGFGFDVFVLGIAQDGGVPQLGCDAECCRRARLDPTQRRMRTALGVRARATKELLLVEATPDVEAQIALLHQLTATTGRGRQPVDACLVTHGHTGHYLGLLAFGREAAASKSLPLYCTQRFAQFVQATPPLALLMSEQHVEPRVVTPGTPFAPLPGLEVEAIPVPHRDEFTDTVAFVLRGPRRSLLFLPDIDQWSKWDRDIAALVDTVDFVLIDGTFYSASELPGRSLEQIPHPLVPKSMELLAAAAMRHPGRIHFIHLNHTNRLLRDASARAALEAHGFRVADEGQWFEL